jgi:hypothetical protein
MLVFLFAIFAGDAGAGPTDIALVANREARKLLAATLNASSKKPAELQFGCHERKPPVRS